AQQDKAAAIVAAAVPQPGQERSSLIVETRAATQALRDVTGSAGMLGGLRGSLRLSNVPSPNELPPGSAELEIPAGSASVQTTGAAGSPPSDPHYYQKLTNLFPAEALAIYGTGV